MCSQVIKASQGCLFITTVPRHRPEHIFSQHWKKIPVCLFNMVKNSGNQNSDVKSEISHRCGPFCLGPLTFHSHAVGDMIRLSQGSRLAEKTRGTFKNGLVFTNRPVKREERIRLRVEKDFFNWHGALRVGFTTVPPSGRPLPLPSMAIPNLTSTPGHWAAPVPESFCQEGSEVKFWFSTDGSIYVASNNSRKHKLLTGVDLSKPLWAMMDIYGQTCSIFLLGSEKKRLVCKRSCPAPEPLISPFADCHDSSHSDVSSLDGNSDDGSSCLDAEIPEDKSCVVCMVREATITLPCGHQCLCSHCASKVSQQFGTCPLCRTKIDTPSVGGGVLLGWSGLQDVRRESPNTSC